MIHSGRRVPERGKFLFVASADQQDISACIYSIARAENAFGTKLEAAKRLHTAKKERHGDSLLGLFRDGEKEEQRFFMRLLGQCVDVEAGPSGESVDSTIATSPSPLEWYLRPSGDLDAYFQQGSRSWVVVHNRVPSALLDQESSTNFEKVVPAFPDQPFSRIVARCRENILARSVAYDPAFALQFVMPELLATREVSLKASLVPEGTDHRRFARPNISSGDHLLHYLLDAHTAFQEAVGRLEGPSATRLRVSWFALSPIWLYTQAVRPAPWSQELDRMSRFGDASVHSAAARFYRNALHIYRRLLRSARAVTWIEEAVLVAYVLRSFLRRPLPRTDQPLPWLVGRLESLHKLVPDEPGLTTSPPSWSREPLTTEIVAHIPEAWLSRIPKALYRWRAFEIQRLLHSLSAAYNHALQAYESVDFMQAVARDVSTGKDHALVLVFAESLLRHVVLERDISLERAERLLALVKTGGPSERSGWVRLSLDMEAVETFTKVLSPILGPEGWRFIIESRIIG